MTVSGLCARVAMTPANFYKGRTLRRQRALDAEPILEMVRQERRLQPRIGTRKLHALLQPELAAAGVGIGRDRLFGLLREHDMLVPPLRGAPRTTDSRHSLPIFRNEAKAIQTTGPNQVWVADITYLDTDEGWLYLSLVMDRHSRQIVGYHADDSLETIGCLEALKMAQASLPEGARPLHHSDRGSQYCSHLYVEQLGEFQMPVSMTELDHCAENAHAERLNGILKQEYGLGATFRSKDQARAAVVQAVPLYNTRRPHAALGYRTPSSVHYRKAG
jgi:transposase InsO family protein